MKQEKKKEFLIKNNGVFNNEDVEQIELMLDKIDNENHPVLQKDYRNMFKIVSIIKRGILVVAIISTVITAILFVLAATEYESMMANATIENYNTWKRGGYNYSFNTYYHDMKRAASYGYIPASTYAIVTILLYTAFFFVSPQKITHKALKKEFDKSCTIN